MTDDQCRLAYKVYTEKMQRAPIRPVIDRHSYFYKDALMSNQFLQALPTRSDDT